MGDPHCSAPVASADDALSLLTLSEIEIHRICWEAHRLGQSARLKLIRGLLAAEATELYKKLGCATIAIYASSQFNYQLSEVQEFLRVGKLLGELPRMTRLFEEGKLCWSGFKEMSRIADRETEDEWLRFAESRSVREIKDEVGRAIDEKRKRPRKDPYGLRNTTVKVNFKLTMDEHDLVRRAFAKVARELSPALQGRKLEPKEVFLHITHLILKSDPNGIPEGRRIREDSLFTVLYHTCRKCRGSHLQTAEGPLEVPGEVVERVEGGAHKVEITPEEEWQAVVEDQPRETEPPKIDRPNTAALSRKVILRDGGKCANCSRRLGLHSHHVIYRSKGGRTVMANGICLCVGCHSLVHEGLLEVIGNPIDGVVFRPRAAKLSEELSLEAEKKELAAVPVIIVPARAGGPPARAESPKDEESPPEMEERCEDVEKALVKLGYRTREAQERVQAACRELRERGGSPRGEVSTDELLREALRPHVRCRSRGGEGGGASGRIGRAETPRPQERNGEAGG